jgi:hypothetical protein
MNDAVRGDNTNEGQASSYGEARHRKDEEKKKDLVLEKDEAELLKSRGDEWRSVVRDRLEAEVSYRIADELPSVATRLIGTEQGLFDQYDRLRAEAEFRISLVPPMAALALTIAFVAFSWISVLIALLELAILIFVIYRILLCST